MAAGDKMPKEGPLNALIRSRCACYLLNKLFIRKMIPLKSLREMGKAVINYERRILAH